MKKESGNILIIILIAIFLLGALTALLARSGGSSNETGSYEQTQIRASELLNWAAGLEKAVTQLRQKGCSENQIDFSYDSDNNGIYREAEPDFLNTYYNPNSPADHSCHVFHPNGGGQTHLGTPSSKNWLTDEDLTWPTDRFFFNRETRISGVGVETNADMILWISSLDRDLCLQVNKILNVDNPSGEAPRDTVGNAIEGAPYIGTFMGGSIVITVDAPELIGKKAGCFVIDAHAAGSSAYNGEDRYYFYYVLHAR